jgi:hypothetical protein
MDMHSLIHACMLKYMIWNDSDAFQSGGIVEVLRIYVHIHTYIQTHIYAHMLTYINTWS